MSKNFGESHEDYQPKGYILRVQPKKKNLENTSTTESPPLWLMLDQTIAVIWSIYSTTPSNKPLGVAQVQWVHQFLKGVRNKEGDHPIDVKICLQDIEEKLIDLYACSAEGPDCYEKVEEYEIENDKKEGRKDRCVRSTKCFLRKKKSSLKSTPSTSSMGSSRQEDKGLRTESSPNIIDNLKKTNSETDGSSTQTNMDPFKQKSVSWHSQQKASIYVIGTDSESPSSVTYQEIMSRRNGTGTSQLDRKFSSGRSYFGVDNSKFKPIDLLRSERVQAEIIGPAVVTVMQSEGQNLNLDISENEILPFLIHWRQEQVNRLKGELKRLHSIEKMMKTIQKKESKY